MYLCARFVLDLLRTGTNFNGPRRCPLTHLHTIYMAALIHPVAAAPAAPPPVTPALVPPAVPHIFTRVTMPGLDNTLDFVAVPRDCLVVSGLPDLSLIVCAFLCSQFFLSPSARPGLGWIGHYQSAGGWDSCASGEAANFTNWLEGQPDERGNLAQSDAVCAVPRHQGRLLGHASAE
jgi:hypothetical protein